MNIDNATVIEFLSLTNPSLIHEWNAHVGIKSLKQLANECDVKSQPSEIEPEISLIDERFVFVFLADFAAANSDPEFFYSLNNFEPRGAIKSLADFFDRDIHLIRKDLLQMWESTKEHFPIECFDEYYNFDKVAAV